jgi:geranylgeranyl reductase family protein
VIRCDALVVGGGPAGSTCARDLRNAGWHVIVADRARFPRDKLCAGWLTPRVFELLELEPSEYQATGLTLQAIKGFRTGVLGRRLVETRYPAVVSYAVRRCEFDDFLLRRAGVQVMDGQPIRTFRRKGDAWIVNDAIEAPVVIGAGGHFCPVAAHLRGAADRDRPVIAKEAEFRLKTAPAQGRSDTPDLFFCHDLEGYGWCVRKGEFLNVGIGRRESRDFATHVKDFVAFLERRYGLPADAEISWRGHAYFARGVGPRPLIGPGMLVTGDAAGLAYPESGEGICPAIESARIASRTLTATRGRYSTEELQPYAKAIRALHPPSSPTPKVLRGAVAALGRMLLGSPTFTRRVVLDRWFLRTTPNSS